MGTITWICVEAALSSRNHPHWMLCAGIDEWDEIYVPAALAGNEMSIHALARRAGEAVAFFGGASDRHVFVRAAWLSRFYPEVAPVVNQMELGILAWLEGYAIDLAPQLEAELRAGRARAEPIRWFRIAA